MRPLPTLAILFLSALTAPAALPHGPAPTTPQRSVSQHGITWTFDRDVPVGRFINGDFYVVGPVTVVALDPRTLVGPEVPESELGTREKARVRNATWVRNGSMRNPPARPEVAYDSGVRNYFKPDLLAVPPIRLQPGDRLVSTISFKVGEEPNFPYHGGRGSREHHDNSPIRVAAVLTCLAQAQPADAFRPSYGDSEARIYLGRNLRRDLLPRLPPPPETPDLDVWLRVFERPWINTCFFGFDQPMENMPHYGQWVGQAQSMGGLLLMLDLDPAKKEQLMIRMVQVGIDYWGLVRNGHRGWPGWGGHGSGRKFPIVLAGLLLGDPEMAAPSRTFPKVEFGEDNQTLYGEGWTGARALFAGHSGIQRASGTAERPHWGPYEHLHPSQWTAQQRQSEAYRRANTSSSWVGQALTLRLLRAEQAWDHPAFFDYVDRWMTDPNDRDHRLEIMRHHPGFNLDDRARHTHQGNAWEPFVRSMWDRHASPPPYSPR
ncbi:MAG: hypothetical protein KF833_04020 [Verrucomicrobiae bacterium]|nr:hypothetical protein [Verrucomicrobiae bacterium]